jgi:DNA polymerase-3 subunit epsilon
VSLSLRLRRVVQSLRGRPSNELQRAWREPLPRSATPARRLRFLACDGEMTGLDPQRDALLSLGWVPIDDGELLPGKARHLLLRPDAGVGQSATIHHLRDCMLRDGVPPAAALTALLRDARGRILVFHNGRLDSAFLDAAAKRIWGVPLLLPWLDTLRIEERLLRRRDHPPREGELQLTACRRRYGLPAHRAHSAVTDAIATGELLLAQIARRGPGLRLRDLR